MKWGIQYDSFPNASGGERPFLGTFVQSAAPEFLEASAYAGFRFAAIDLEHTYYGVEKMAELIRAGEAAGLSMLARVPALDAVWIKKSLDFGAAGVIVPNIDTPEQAAQAVALCKFTPEGIRGACPGVPGLTATEPAGANTMRKPTAERRSFRWWSPRRELPILRRSSVRPASPPYF